MILLKNMEKQIHVLFKFKDHNSNHLKYLGIQPVFSAIFTNSNSICDS